MKLRDSSRFRVSLYVFGLMIVLAAVAKEIFAISTQTGKAGRTLHYYLEAKGSGFSLDPSNIDASSNFLLGKSVIGTLTQKDSSDRAVAAMAESWTSSKDLKSWKFKLRDDLVCSDGSTISAPIVKDSLEKLLRIHASHNTKVTAFNKVIGWDAFASGKNSHLDGFKVVGDKEIELLFVEPMDAEIVAYLSVPHFGFYCPSNFNADGSFNSKGPFVSSGSYSVESAIDQPQINLRLRTDWALNSPEQFKNVIVEQKSSVDIRTLQSDSDFFVLRSNGFRGDITPNVDVFEGAKIQLIALNISPFVGNIFSDKDNRQVLRDRLIAYFDKNPIPNIAASMRALSFYPEFPDANFKNVTEKKNYSTKAIQKKKMKITVSTKVLPSAADFVVQALQEVTKDLDIDIEPVAMDSNDPKEVQKYWSNHDYEFRLSWGGISTISTGILDMMFCSAMGLSFPDPDGHVCNLVRSYQGKSVVTSELAADFNKLLREDATVVPLFHNSAIFISSKNVNTKNLAPFHQIPDLRQVVMR